MSVDQSANSPQNRAYRSDTGFLPVYFALGYILPSIWQMRDFYPLDQVPVGHTIKAILTI